MMIFMVLLFLISIQPMLMIVMLMVISLLYSLMVYNFMGSYWFSYALVLVMLSGVLVVLTYMVSLIPNESFEIYNLIFIALFMIIVFKVGHEFYLIDYSFFSLYLWNSYVGMFNLFLVIFLLSLMVMVVWLSILGSGGVRVM